MDWIAKAKEIGFADAAFLPVEKLTVVPAYRKYCEENLCGCYGKLAACPPVCGTVEEMTAKMRRYPTALILQSVLKPGDLAEPRDYKAEKNAHNRLSEKLLEEMAAEGLTDTLFISAGPHKGNSCMSAYCIDAQKMADAVGMDCWKDDGACRYFTLILLPY